MRSGLPRLALLPLPLVTAPSPSSGHLPPAPSLSLRLGGTGDLSVERPEPYLSLYISSGGWAGGGGVVAAGQGVLGLSQKPATGAKENRCLHQDG